MTFFSHIAHWLRGTVWYNDRKFQRFSPEGLDPGRWAKILSEQKDFQFFRIGYLTLFKKGNIVWIYSRSN